MKKLLFIVVFYLRHVLKFNKLFLKFLYVVFDFSISIILLKKRISQFLSIYKSHGYSIFLIFMFICKFHLTFNKYVFNNFYLTYYELTEKIYRNFRLPTKWEFVVSLPERPPTSIFFRFLASRITTVNLPAVGTYRSEKQMSPSLFSFKKRKIKKNQFNN